MFRPKAQIKPKDYKVLSGVLTDEDNLRASTKREHNLAFKGVGPIHGHHYIIRILR